MCWTCYSSSHQKHHTSSFKSVIVSEDPKHVLVWSKVDHCSSYLSQCCGPEPSIYISDSVAEQLSEKESDWATWLHPTRKLFLDFDVLDRTVNEAYGPACRPTSFCDLPKWQFIWTDKRWNGFMLHLLGIELPLDPLIDEKLSASYEWIPKEHARRPSIETSQSILSIDAANNFQQWDRAFACSLYFNFDVVQRLTNSHDGPPWDGTWQKIKKVHDMFIDSIHDHLAVKMMILLRVWYRMINQRAYVDRVDKVKSLDWFDILFMERFFHNICTTKETDIILMER